MSKPKISVEVTQEQYDLIRDEAKAAGRSVSDHVRLRLFPEAAPPPPPIVPPQPGVVSIKPRHACKYLAAVFPPNFSEKDCQGTCMHLARKGSPCFWVSTQAFNCDKFESHRR